MPKNHIIPGLRYKDAPAAIEWLCHVLGFEKKMIVPAENNLIAHAQLTLGDSMIMLGSHREDQMGKLICSPIDIELKNTQSAYVVLSEDKIEAHYQHAKLNGAEILDPLETQDYGGKNYICRDLEGHVWSFGSYDPWVEIK